MGKVSRTTYVLSLLVVFFLPPALFAGLGVQLHTVTTGSMRPAIQPGAVVLTRLVKAEDIKKGHVILYFDTQTDNPVSHRVIAVNHLGNQVSITTKGDANAKADPTILEPNSVPIATVIGVLPGVGFIVSALHSTPAKVGLGFLLAILIALSFFYERHRKALHQAHDEISDKEVAEIEPDLPVESQVEVDEEDLQVEMEPTPPDLIEEEVLVEDESELIEEPQPIELSEPAEIFEEENCEEEVVSVEVQPVVPEEFWISEPTSSEIEISHQLNEVLLAQSDLDLELNRLEAQFHEEISRFVEVEKVQKKNKDDKKKAEKKTAETNKKNKKNKEAKKKESKEKKNSKKIKKSKKKEYEEASKSE